MNQVATIERDDAPLPAVSETAAILQVIERAAANPAVDIDKMERLLLMQERIVARNAKAAYSAALADMQPRLPVIERKGMIRVPPKDGKTGHETPYALWEDINEAIRPLLSEHGFALSFRIKKDADRVEVTGVLSHRQGHSEETTLSLPMDTTGSKNNVQAIGSSTSYGKRYTAMALLNITTRGEDDDGESADPTALITEEQAKNLRTIIEEVEADTAAFCAFLKVESIPDIPASKYDEAVRQLQRKRAARAHK